MWIYVSIQQGQIVIAELYVLFYWVTWANQKSAVFIILCDISSFCGPKKFDHKSILNNTINMFFVYCVMQVCMVNIIIVSYPDWLLNFNRQAAI